MRTANKKVAQKISKINRKNLKNNTQKAFLRLVTTKNTDGWVARTTFGIPSVSARIRDLRKKEYGGFVVECSSAEDINKKGESRVTTQQTYYRIVPTTVTEQALNNILKGVI